MIHTVSFPERHRQYVHVTSRFPPGAVRTDLRLPTWAPGSYLQLPFDASLEILGMRAGGRELSWQKLEKDSWRIVGGAEALTEGQSLEVRYRVRADRRSVSASWVSEDYVQLTGSSVFLYTDDSRYLPQLLTLSPPTGPGRAVSSLLSTGPGTWRAGDYDELVDNPLVISGAEPLSFDRDGHRYHLLNVGDDRLWDTDAALGDLESLVGAVNDFFETVPLDRDYWFFNLLNEENGGLEHDHSTVMQASRWQMTDRRAYVRWLSLASHEYFHVWNVRRMRPAALARYDYRQPQYTPSLWVAEGLSSYYDDLLLSRARVATAAEYLERLAAHVHLLENTPGRLRHSLAQASRDAWTRHYQPRPNALNQDVSYYVKGAVVGFVLDAHIREESRGRRSLDDVMRLMWSRWRQTPYPEGAFSDALGDVAGPEAVDWLRPLVEGLAEPDVDEALGWFGLELDRTPLRAAADVEGAAPPSGLGINWVDSGRALVADVVVDGGPAARAGMLPGDELLAVDGERLTRLDYEAKLRRLVPGTTVTLLLARQGRILSRDTTLSEARPLAYRVLARGTLRERELRRLSDWLGQRVSSE